MAVISPVAKYRALEGNLGTIVLKALCKEPERRYAAVEQLSEDIGRHLDGLPITARPDTVRYRVSKFVQRHKALVTASGAIAVCPIGGIIVSASRGAPG
ncbi:MAG: serine/threonine protein kinase with repeat [Edaphobacter sp.]|nr:serine/threonine protein kinase with repeat [Edaphobacter sp.]